MKISCIDRERVFLDGTAEEWTELERHASACRVCAREIRAWKALSTAAEEMRDYRGDAQLWMKIQTALRKQGQTRAARAGFWERLGLPGHLSPGWQAALAGALVLVLALAGAYVVRDRRTDGPKQNRLLQNSALARVERSERDYEKAIEALAQEAKPELNSPATPLMASYREKLMVLDSAIDELRAEAGQNPSNAHLRYQLLAMYQEKQQTLQEVLETKP
jgi:tetratricopeptide (TPR) repeat protein